MPLALMYVWQQHWCSCNMVTKLGSNLTKLLHILILTLNSQSLICMQLLTLWKSENSIAEAADADRNNSCSNEMVTRWQVSSAKSQDWQPFPSHRRVRVMAHRGTGCSREMSQRKWMLFDVFQLNNARDPFYIYSSWDAEVAAAAWY